jgi:hypothetical protein
MATWRRVGDAVRAEMRAVEPTGATAPRSQHRRSQSRASRRGLLPDPRDLRGRGHRWLRGEQPRAPGRRRTHTHRRGRDRAGPPRYLDRRAKAGPGAQLRLPAPGDPRRGGQRRAPVRGRGVHPGRGRRSDRRLAGVTDECRPSGRADRDDRSSVLFCPSESTRSPARATGCPWPDESAADAALSAARTRRPRRFHR